MYYPYSKESIQAALKEVRGDIDSPIVWESLQLMEIKGNSGVKGKGIYYFKTEDGKEYEMMVEGYYTRGHCHRKLFNPHAIISLKEKK